MSCEPWGLTRTVLPGIQWHYSRLLTGADNFPSTQSLPNNSYKCQFSFCFSAKLKKGCHLFSKMNKCWRTVWHISSNHNTCHVVKNPKIVSFSAKKNTDDLYSPNGVFCKLNNGPCRLPTTSLQKQFHTIGSANYKGIIVDRMYKSYYYLLPRIIPGTWYLVPGNMVCPGLLPGTWYKGMIQVYQYCMTSTVQDRPTCNSSHMFLYMILYILYDHLIVTDCVKWTTVWKTQS